MTRREWLAIASAAPFAAAAEMPNLTGIDRFFDDFLRDWVRADPELATELRLFTGDEMNRLDSRLTEVSDDAAHARIARAKQALLDLRKFDRTKLTPEQRVSADLLDFQLNDVIGEEPFLAYSFPLNQFITGVQLEFPTFMTDIHPVHNRQDAENYLSRLEAGGAKIDAALAIMHDRAKRNIRPPAFIGVETAAQIRRFTAPSPERNILVTSFAERLAKVDSVDPAQRAILVANAEKIVSATVYPAYRRAADGLATDNAKAGEDAGIWRLPRGGEAYAFYLRRYTTTTMTSQQIHQKGVDEVRRIEADLDRQFKKLGYSEGSIDARWLKLQSADVYPDGPDVRDRVLADYAKIVRENDERSAEVFNRRPKAPCVVERIPEFQEANAAPNYQTPAADGSRPGIFRVTLPGPRFSRPRMRTLAAHEAIPGHHFALGLQVEMTSLPAFRRQSPFRPISAFAEGWALYSEQLASDLGWYNDDAPSDIGRLNDELFRARRLVVDTGLHSLHWTREQAIDFGIEPSEVDRYVVWPGQACSYKIGQMKILELREESKTVMGPKFSLKGFHDVVLGNGEVPLVLLERVVRDWQKR